MPPWCDFPSAQRVNSVFISALIGCNCMPICYFFSLIAHKFYEFVLWKSLCVTFFAFQKKYFSLNVFLLFPVGL